MRAGHPGSSRRHMAMAPRGPCARSGASASHPSGAGPAWPRRVQGRLAADDVDARGGGGEGAQAQRLGVERIMAPVEMATCRRRGGKDSSPPSRSGTRGLVRDVPQVPGPGATRRPGITGVHDGPSAPWRVAQLGHPLRDARGGSTGAASWRPVPQVRRGGLDGHECFSSNRIWDEGDEQDARGAGRWTGWRPWQQRLRGGAEWMHSMAVMACSAIRRGVPSARSSVRFSALAAVARWVVVDGRSTAGRGVARRVVDLGRAVAEPDLPSGADDGAHSVTPPSARLCKMSCSPGSGTREAWAIRRYCSRWRRGVGRSSMTHRQPPCASRS